MLVLFDPNVSLAQCSLIISGLVEWLVVVVADVEVSGESGISGTEGGRSEEVAEEGDIGGGDKCGGRVRSYDLRRRAFRSVTGRSLCGGPRTGRSLTGRSLAGGSHTGLGVLAR